MPVASPSTVDEDPKVAAHLRCLLPSSHCDDQQAFAELGLSQLSGLQAGSSPAHEPQYFNTISPPLLNLSPSLSPADTTRNSPVAYDFRESTVSRRRNYQGTVVIFIKLCFSCLLHAWYSTLLGSSRNSPSDQKENHQL